MKNLAQVLIAFLFLPCLLTSCAKAQARDLLTDQAVRDALAKISGFKSMGNLCIKRMSESAKIILIGNHANDRDCRIDGAFIDSRYLPETDAAFSKTALAALGWNAANQEQREQLAGLWVEKGLLAFYTVLYEKHKDFTVRTGFHPPQIASAKNGETSVSLWTSAMRRKVEFQRHKFRFAKDGNYLEGSTR